MKPVHTCPVCGTRHEVSPILHRLAYGRALTCSPRCKTAFPALARRRSLDAMPAFAGVCRRAEACEE